MQLYTIGVNHTTAPISIREHVSFQPEELSNALKSITQFGASEAAILSTCNRTELYVTAENPLIITNWLADYHRQPLQQLQPYLYTHSQESAVKHAFRVASGLDSMVLGEAQILGQF